MSTADRSSEPTTGVGHLAGVKVLDLTGFAPGPFATQILADLGCTVLKVERPPRGDPQRAFGSYFHALNRGKRSIALDMSVPEDRSLLHSLAAEADVLVEGNRPGAADRMGVGFDEVSKRNSRLIYVSIPGLPADSAFRDLGPHDPEILARLGALSVLSGDGKSVPRLPFHVSAYAAGMYAVIGILAALVRPREAPVHLEAPTFSAGLAWVFPDLVRLNSRSEGSQNESERAGAPGTGMFTTSDGRQLMLSSFEDGPWSRLCRVIERSDLAGDPALATLPQRIRRFDELDAVLREAFLRRTLPQWELDLAAHAISFGPVRSPSEVFSDPVVSSLGMLRESPAGQLALALPLTGLTSTIHDTAPALDADGALVRREGWSAIR